jgi:hypothetical protein
MRHSLDASRRRTHIESPYAKTIQQLKARPTPNIKITKRTQFSPFFSTTRPAALGLNRPIQPALAPWLRGAGAV